MAYTNKDTVIKKLNEGANFQNKNFDNFRDDKEIVLLTVRNNGLYLEFASDRLRNDKEVVLAAVKEFGASMYFASDELKNDKEVVLTAIKDDAMAFKFAGKELKHEIGEQDPIKYLENYFLKIKLTEVLKINQAETIKPIMKI